MSVQEDEPDIRRRNYWYLYVIVVLLAAYLTTASAALYIWLHRCEECRTEATDRHLTFITVNDTYRIDGVADDTLGGLHRLQTLLEWVRRDAPDAILLHAGDFLGPSLISKEFEGEQMIQVLNILRGNAADNRMFAVFGNHEFDYSRCDKVASLPDRVKESRFKWLNANLDFANCQTMRSLATDEKVLSPDTIQQINGVKVGLFGIGLTPAAADNKESSSHPAFKKEIATAEESIKNLKEHGAEFVVAVTHLPWERDEQLLRELVPKGLDLLVGGHDHNWMVLKDKDDVARGFKADSDARTVWRIDVDLTVRGKPAIKAQLITLNDAIRRNSDIKNLADSWLTKADPKICERWGQQSGCLKDAVGWTQTPIELDETVNRSQETAFGDWLTDEILKISSKKNPDGTPIKNPDGTPIEKPDVAIIGAGLLGLNDNLKPGDVTFRHLEEIFRYDAPILVEKIGADVVCEALRHGFVRPGSGAWPHIGGVHVDIDKKIDQGKQITVVTIKEFSKKGINCLSTEKINVATVPYLLCGGDEYPFFDFIGSNEKIGDCTARLGKDRSKATNLSAIAKTAIVDAGKAGIQPIKDGRVRIRSTNPDTASK